MNNFDPDKLKENAVTSIRLGSEDFEKCRAPIDQGGDPARALSAARNLFSGVLLLFKFKIANLLFFDFYAWFLRETARVLERTNRQTRNNGKVD